MQLGQCLPPRSRLQTSNAFGLLPAACRCRRRTQRYEAHIWQSKKQIYLGGFDSEVTAAKSHGESSSNAESPGGALWPVGHCFGHGPTVGT